MSAKVRTIKMKELKFSLFYDPIKGIYNSTPHKEITLHELIAIYQSDFIKTITLKIQSELDREKQKKLKNELPSFTPDGTFFPNRSRKTIVHHNDQLIAIDVDGISEQSAITLRNKLASKEGCVICTVSPRKKGVKAIFLISDTIPLKGKRKLLEHNTSALCKALDIEDYINEIDRSQFNESQVVYIAFDPDGYFNPSPDPLKIDLSIPEIKVYKPIKIGTQNLLDGSKKRIQIYLKIRAEKMINYMLNLPKGNRHANMWKVIKIKSDLHYLPEMESDIKGAFETMIHQMYHDEGDSRIDAEMVWMGSAWNHAIDLRNPIIDQIIEDEDTRIKIINRVQKVQTTQSLKDLENFIIKLIDNEK